MSPRDLPPSAIASIWPHLHAGLRASLATLDAAEESANGDSADAADADTEELIFEEGGA